MQRQLVYKGLQPKCKNFVKRCCLLAQTRKYTFDAHQGAKICVVGVGGGGCNAINNMIKTELQGVEFVAVNTDSQCLQESLCQTRVQIGKTTTKGLGAGAKPQIGKVAAEEEINEVIEKIKHANMLFITAGMGGGTGTGASPIIAKAARDLGILTVAVVTTPFEFEGYRRMESAKQGIKEMKKCVDTLITISNQNLLQVLDRNVSFTDSFKTVDKVLYEGVRGLVDLIITPGLINLDFADVCSVMSTGDNALLATGVGEGPNRAIDSVKNALNNPLLNVTSIQGARNVLLSIAGGDDLTLHEVEAIAEHVRSQVDEHNTNIIFGASFDSTLQNKIKVTLCVTGLFDLENNMEDEETVEFDVELNEIETIDNTELTQEQLLSGAVPKTNAENSNDKPKKIGEASTQLYRELNKQDIKNMQRSRKFAHAQQPRTQSTSTFSLRKPLETGVNASVHKTKDQNPAQDDNERTESFWKKFFKKHW